MTNTKNPFKQKSRGNALPGTDAGALEDLLFGMHAGRWALNMQSGEVHCSEKWAEIIGYKLEEISPGTLEIHKEHISPCYLLNEVYETMWAQCQEKGLDMTLDIPDTMENIKIEADRELLLKAMIHILDNAIKFTEKGNITIGLETKGKRLCIFVKDTGVGMESGFLDKLFEPFSQEDAAITRGYEGSGLGLSIASGIVKRLDAEMHVETQKAKGSNFVICFRMKQDDAQANAGQMADSVSATDAEKKTPNRNRRRCNTCITRHPDR